AIPAASQAIQFSHVFLQKITSLSIRSISSSLLPLFTPFSPTLSPLYRSSENRLPLQAPH
ncbi:MAG TPA: hypothetical protein DGU45_03110, partial [Planctomycetes bacterium]|nr:hypothetical protein [Planctomycetota bacterium]